MQGNGRVAMAYGRIIQLMRSSTNRAWEPARKIGEGGDSQDGSARNHETTPSSGNSRIVCKKMSKFTGW